MYSAAVSEDASSSQRESVLFGSRRTPASLILRREDGAVVATTAYAAIERTGRPCSCHSRLRIIMSPKVLILGGGNPSTATTELIDLSAATPGWGGGPPMSQPRIEMGATILPNGKVLAYGGSLNDEDAATASLNADLYDPATNSMALIGAGTNTYPAFVPFRRVALTRRHRMVGGRKSKSRHLRAAHGNLPAGLFVHDRWFGHCNTSHKAIDF